MKAWHTIAHANLAAAAGKSLLRPGAMLPVAILLGLVLRCLHLESHELQYDEGATGYFAALPWSDLWSGAAVLEPNPPLFYSIAWLVTHGGGTVEQIRYVSAIAGVLCIPVAWLIARVLAGSFAAAGAALLVGASPQHIAISQYARAYALLTLLLMGAFYCLLRARSATAPPLQKERRRALPWLSGYILCAVAALYTHHTAIVILAALNVAVPLVLLRTGDAWRCFLTQWLVANLIVAAFYAPWLPVLFSQVHPSAAPPAAVMSSSAIVRAPLLPQLWTMISNPVGFAGLPWIDVWILPVILFAAWRFRRSRDAAFMAAFVLGGLLLMLAASQLRPLIDSKTLAWAGLFAVVVTAVGCSAAGRFRLPLLFFAILLELRTVPAALNPAPEGWRDIAAILQKEALSQDTFYTNYAAAALPLRHYGWSESGITMKVFARSDDEPWFRGRSWPIIAPQAVAGDAQQAGRVWVLAYGTTSPDGITNEIATTLVRALHRRTEKLDLSLFVPSAPRPADAAAAPP